MNNFCSVGLFKPKTNWNVGGALRASYCYGAKMVAIQDPRTDIKAASDTPKTWTNIPVIKCPDLKNIIPYGSIPVAVDLLEGATDLRDFSHPQRAFYIFGPEDGTIPKDILDWCPHKVFIDTATCMNLAASVNVVLYSRSIQWR